MLDKVCSIKSNQKGELHYWLVRVTYTGTRALWSGQCSWCTTRCTSVVTPWLFDIDLLMFVCLCVEGERTQGVADPGITNKAIPDPSGRGRPAYRTCTLVVPPPQHGQLPGWERRTGQKPGSLVCNMDRAHRLGYPCVQGTLPPCGIPSVAWHWRTTIQPGWGPEVPAQVVPRTKLTPNVLGIRLVFHKTDCRVLPGADGGCVRWFSNFTGPT